MKDSMLLNYLVKLPNSRLITIFNLLSCIIFLPFLYFQSSNNLLFFQIMFFNVLLHYFIMILVIVIGLLYFKKEVKLVLIFVGVNLYIFIFGVINPLNLAIDNYYVDRKLNEIIHNYNTCNNKNCRNNSIFTDDKVFQIDTTDKCVTIKPVHNYNFLYYEMQKCGDEIKKKEYHSTVKFMKNVATLNFSSVFGL